jgi:hypothetical protein
MEQQTVHYKYVQSIAYFTLFYEKCYCGETHKISKKIKANKIEKKRPL